MGYLEQFARNRRSKEKTEVLTARLPESLYSDFKDYCEELGLSISEAIYLLVEREMKGISKEISSKTNTLKTKSTTIDDKKNDDVVITNTQLNTDAIKEISAAKEENTSVIVSKPPVPKKTSPLNNDTIMDTIVAPARFTTKRWEVDGKLPCPKCDQWVSAANFSRHAKSHGTTTKEIFTNRRYLEKVEEMIKESQ